MKKLLIFFFYSLSTLVFAQEQMTNFENDSTKSPNNLIYLGLLDNRAFFTAFTPEDGNEIWVSDGTENGTQLLKDINKGELGIYPYSFVIFNSWAYFLVDSNIWKTDGTPENTYEVAKSNKANQEYFLQLAVIENKLLAVLQSYKTTQNFDFYWLTEADKLVKWEQKVVNYNVNENSLFFTKNTGSESIPTYTLYHYLQNSKAVYSTQSFITGLVQFKNETDIYCSITTNYGPDLLRTLIKIDEKQSLKNQIFDWGNHQNTIPLYLKNNEGDFFLLKASSFKNSIDTLFLYKTKSNGIILNQKLGGKEINFPFSFTGGDKFYSNTIFKKNTLFFVNGFTIEGGNVFYYNYFDFTNDTFKQIKAVYFADSYNTIKVIALNDSLYKVTTDYTSNTYNSKANEIIEKTSKTPDNEKSFFELNNQRLEISDNIYKILGIDKIPLIANRKIYKGNNSDNVLINQFYKGKQYFLFNNYSQKKSELWVMDTLSASRVKINNGQCSSVFQVKNLSDKLFYAIWDSSQLSIYQTDGTTNGTSLAYLFRNMPGSVPRVGYTNDNLISVVYNDKNVIISKDRTDEISVKEGYPIYTDKNVYIIKNNNTSSSLYKLENGQLKYVLQSNNFYDSFVFENRFYFKNGQQLNYLDENEKVVNITVKLEYLFPKSNNYNNYLVYREYISNENYTYNVIDLRTNKVVSKVQARAGLDYHFENNKGFYFIRASYNTPARVGIYDGKDTYEVFSADVDIVSFPKMYKNGILIQYPLSNQNQNMLVYYDFIEKKFTNILTNSLPFSIKVNQKSDFILIEQFLANNERAYQIWSYKTNSLKSVTTEKGEIFSDGLPAGNYTTSSYTYNYGTLPFIWSFQNDTLLRQEPTLKNINEVKFEDIVLFQTKYLIEQGNELFAIGDGFSINFAEIIKGTEGIYLGSTFVFNNQLYVYAFTYSYGWQVWKMQGSYKTLPLSKEEGLEELISVFPNPVEDLLHIETSRQFNYRIINSMGQEIMKGKLIYQQPINLENLVQGLYIIQFYDGGKTFSKKIIKY